MIKYFLTGFTLCFCHFTILGQVNPSWEQWVKTNSYNISTTDTNNFHDLSFLKETLKDKKIVFLGENSHGVSEFTSLKSRMIRYLHDSLAFDVLAFESNSGDAYAANMAISSSDANTSIYNSISSLWHVEEIVPLFNYIKKTHTTKNPLEIAGVDITSSNGSYSFSRFLYKLILPVNSLYAKEIKESDSLCSRLGIRQWTIGNILSKEEKDTFKTIKRNQLAVYSNLIDFLVENKNKFPQNESKNIEAAKFYLQSRIEFIHWSNRDTTYMINKLPLKDSRMSFEKLFTRYRDYMMAQNLKFLTETLYPERKIIVWAEDSHIRKTKYRMATDSSYAKFTYTIGFLCYSGKGCFAFGQAFDGSNPDSAIYEFKTPTDNLSIEKILHCSNHENTFVDMLYQNKCDGNSWMFETSKWTGWDGNDISEELNIKNAFDGFILVNRISPPKYIKYNYEYLNKDK